MVKFGLFLTMLMVLSPSASYGQTTAAEFHSRGLERVSRFDYDGAISDSTRVKQDYAGGGTYSSKIYRSSAQDRMIGCPAVGAK